jgi:predicted helicase
MAIVTARDNLTIHLRKEQVEKTVQDFRSLSEDRAREKYKLGDDARDWKVNLAQSDLNKDFSLKKIVPINYKPFDKRYTYYSGSDKGFHCRPRKAIMKHFLSNENIGLLTDRTNSTNRIDHYFVSDKLTDCFCLRPHTYIFPLYLYPVGDTLYFNGDSHILNRNHNFELKIVKKIAKKLKMTFVETIDTLDQDNNHFTPLDLFDYVYAVLYSPRYREKYHEFLKTGYPKIPYPTSTDYFWKMVGYGSKLRHLHLLLDDELEKNTVGYPQSGTNQITHSLTAKDLEYTDKNKKYLRIWINDQQYFDHIPAVAVQFTIGGYSPVLDWLKNRKDLILHNEDIIYFSKMVTALTKTVEIMDKIDK